MRKIIALLLILISTTIVLYAQELIVPVESSETWANNQHQPEKLMDAIGLKKGMTIADIGAGRGRMSVFFSVRVSETGKVFANDIDKAALEYLKLRCERNNLNNIVIIQGNINDPMLPHGQVDIAFMLMTYHHLAQPVDMMKNTIPCLKKEGILVIVEHDPERSGETGSEVTPFKKLTKEANEAGFEIIETNKKLLERDNIYFLRVK